MNDADIITSFPNRRASLSFPAAGQEPRESPDGKPSEGQLTEEQELFVRFLRGENQALVRLFDLHNHRLFLYCLHYVHDTARAEDLTQEIWERLIRMRAKGGARADNPIGLMITIARNLCTDEMRRRREHASIESLSDSQHPHVTIPELSHLEELVILALPRLPMSQREVLTLHAYCGYRFTEIAEMLGESEGTIKMRAWRGREHLARIINAQIGVDEDRQIEEHDAGEEGL